MVDVAASSSSLPGGASDSSPAAPVAPLSPAPAAAVSEEGVPVFGGFVGIVDSAALGGLAASHRLGGREPMAALRRHVRRKSWVYVFAATPEMSLALALVDGAVTGTAFLMATDLTTGESLVGSSRKLALAAVNDAPGDGLHASYRLPGTRYSVDRRDDEVRVQVSLARSVLPRPGPSRPWVELDLTLRETGVGITAISEVQHGDASAVSVTAKTAGMAVSGTLQVHGDGAGRRFVLDGGFGGYDYTQGLLPRHTAWRWAYGTGRLADGTVLGLNLVEGFSGIGERSRENALWIDGSPVALDARTRFEFDRSDVMSPWSITTADGAVRLRFDPVAAHDERLDLKLLRSLFIQPVGHFSGEVDAGGRTYVLDRVPGVVEDQDILW